MGTDTLVTKLRSSLFSSKAVFALLPIPFVWMPTLWQAAPPTPFHFDAPPLLPSMFSSVATMLLTLSALPPPPCEDPESEFPSPPNPQIRSSANVLPYHPCPLLLRCSPRSIFSSDVSNSMEFPRARRGPKPPTSTRIVAAASLLRIAVKERVGQ